MSEKALSQQAYLKEIGKRIRDARIERKLSQEQLGAPFGVSKGAVSLWESGKGQIESHRIPLLCETLRKSADWLLRGIDVPLIDADALRVLKFFNECEVDRRDIFMNVAASFGKPSTPDAGNHIPVAPSLLPKQLQKLTQGKRPP